MKTKTVLISINLDANISNPTMRTGLDFESAQLDQQQVMANFRTVENHLKYCFINCLSLYV